MTCSLDAAFVCTNSGMWQTTWSAICWRRRCSPSAVAKDPWALIIVRDRGMLSRIADGLPNGAMLRDAAVGIVVCGDLQRAHDRQLSYLLQLLCGDRNLLLAANALGLGACWLGVHPHKEPGEAPSVRF